MIFQAYTPDFGQPLCGGGRYNTILPAVGFAIGLERLMTALGAAPSLETAIAISISNAAARTLRKQGKRVIQAWTNNQTELEEAARAWGVPYIVLENTVIRLSDGANVRLEEIC